MQCCPTISTVEHVSCHGVNGNLVWYNFTVIRKGWIPPVSPYGLLQESLWPSEWLILVSCMLLNCTSRKQVEGVLPEFTKRWPTPEEFSRADRDEVRSLIAPLGFKDRRTDNLIRMTEDFLSGSWEHVLQLHGVGDYAARCWEILCLGEIGDEPPKDHALVRYFEWIKARGCQKVTKCAGD